MPFQKASTLPEDYYRTTSSFKIRQTAERKLDSETKRLAKVGRVFGPGHAGYSGLKRSIADASPGGASYRGELDQFNLNQATAAAKPLGISGDQLLTNPQLLDDPKALKGFKTVSPNARAGKAVGFGSQTLGAGTPGSGKPVSELERLLLSRGEGTSRETPISSDRVQFDASGRPIGPSQGGSDLGATLASRGPTTGPGAVTDPKDDMIKQLMAALTKSSPTTSLEDQFKALSSAQGLPGLAGQVGTFDEEISKAQGLLTDLDARIRGGLSREEARLAPLEIISGRQGELLRQGQADRQTAVDLLANLNESRDLALDTLDRKEESILRTLGFRSEDRNRNREDVLFELNARQKIKDLFAEKIPNVVQSTFDDQGNLNILVEDAQGNFTTKTFPGLGKKTEKYTSYTTKTNDQGDVTVIGIKRDGTGVDTLGTVKGAGTASGGTLSPKEASDLGLPPSLIGKNEAQVMKELGSSTIPPWFTDFINLMETSGRVISSQETTARWEEFRRKVLTTVSSGGSGKDSGRTP